MFSAVGPDFALARQFSSTGGLGDICARTQIGTTSEGA